MSRMTSFGFGFTRLTLGAKWIIIITAGVFALQLLNGNIPEDDVTQNLLLHSIRDPNFQIWQPLTYMFVHGGFWHIFFNMLALWMFGSPYENEYGLKRFLQLYLISGVSAGVIYALFVPHFLLIGASGGVYGVLVAFAYFWPNVRVYVWGIFPIKAKFLVMAFMGIGLFMSLANSPDDKTAHFAHLIGGVVGFIFLQFVHKRYPILNWSAYFFQKKKAEVEIKAQKKKEAKVVYKEDWVREKVDRLLEKVSKNGLDSLTKKEKEFLDKVSMNYKSGSDD